MTTDTLASGPVHVQGAVKKRNADYSTILRRIALPHQPALVATENPLDEPPPGHTGTHSLPPHLRAAAQSPAVSRPTSAGRREESLPNPDDLPAAVLGDAAPPAPKRADAAAIGFRSAAMTVWCGDFNYRIDMDRYAPRPHMASHSCVLAQCGRPYSPPRGRGQMSRRQAVSATSGQRVMPDEPGGRGMLPDVNRSRAAVAGGARCRCEFQVVSPCVSCVQAGRRIGPQGRRAAGRAQGPRPGAAADGGGARLPRHARGRARLPADVQVRQGRAGAACI